MADPHPPVVLVIGDVAPLVQEAAERVVARAIPSCGLAAFNHSRYRAGDCGTAPVSAARTPPMMADLRLVEVRDLEEASPALLEALVEYLADPSPSTLLLLVGGGLPKVVKGEAAWGVRLRNAVKKVGEVEEIKATGVDLPRFAARIASGLGKRLAAADAKLLVEWIGADAGRVQREVEKLALYVGEREAITAEDVRSGSALLAEAEIWDLTGAIAARNADAALGATHRLLERGEDARRLLAMIAWQLRDVARATELLRAGVPEAAVREQVRLRFDVLRAVKERAARGASTAAVMEQLARANRAMNEHRAGDTRVLEALVLALST